MKIEQLLEKIVNNKNLSLDEAKFLMEQMMEGKVSEVQMAAILVGLRMKGESENEILGFIKAMREKMTKVKTKGLVIDTCGTGGDKSGSFNISTAAALVVAGAGVKVAKHGNRSVSSNCGSADVLEELGVNIMLEPKQTVEVLNKAGIVFLFAPLYHPAMKNIALVRQALKLRTVFNFLGPLVNPAEVKRQLLGVANLAVAKKLVKVAKRLAYKHLMLVCSKDGLDEISISAPSHIFEIKGNKVVKKIIKPEDFGIKRVSKKYLLGGKVEENARIIKQILVGKKGPQREVVILNSGTALYVSGKVRTINQGIKLAQESIDKGKAKETLNKLIRISNNF